MTTPRPLNRTDLREREDLVEDSYLSVVAAAAVSRVLAAGSSRAGELEGSLQERELLHHAATDRRSCRQVINAQLSRSSSKQL